MHPDFLAFLDHLRVLQKSPRTVARYGDVLRDLAAHAGDLAPAGMNREVLRRFAATARRDGHPRSPAGVNLRLAVVRALFRYLVVERGQAANPAMGLVGVPEPRRTPKYLTVGEVRRLVEHVAAREGPLRLRNLALVVLFWQTGLRVSEVAGLGVGQVDHDARLLREVRRKGGHVLDALLNDEVLALVRAYLAERGELVPDAPLFARADGGRLSVRAIQALFETWRSELGWTRALHPHVLRHTLATGALDDGTDLATVADLLGHHGLRQVLVYAHVQDRARREALARLGRHVPRSVLPPPAPIETAVPMALPGNVRPPEEPPCIEGPFDAGSAINQARRRALSGPARRRGRSMASKSFQHAFRGVLLLLLGVVLGFGSMALACGGGDAVDDATSGHGGASSSPGSGDPGGTGGDGGAAAGSGMSSSGGGGDIGAGCTKDDDCDDGHSCTIDTCNDGSCLSTIGPNSGDTACPLGLHCDLEDGCAEVVCADDTDCDAVFGDDPCQTATCDPVSALCSSAPLDKDGDGHSPIACGGDDCDDADPERFGGNQEDCDGKDNDCDGEVDLGATCDDAMYVCSGGACICPPENDCDGWCVDLMTSWNNCGTCGHVCPVAAECMNGMCACEGDETYCEDEDFGPQCIDTMTDSSHCGDCGNTCGELEVCEDGVCACAATLCAGECVDTQKDGGNCGGCGKMCSENAECSLGNCECQFDYAKCGGACVDLDTDPKNCGACGTVCPATCKNGTCACIGEKGSGQVESACDAMPIALAPKTCGVGGDKPPPGLGVCHLGFQVYTAGSAEYLLTCLGLIKADAKAACDTTKVQACVDKMYVAACDSPDAEYICQIVKDDLCFGQPFDTITCASEMKPLSDDALSEVLGCVNSQALIVPCQEAYDECFKATTTP